MEYPTLGEIICNGEAVVIAKERTYYEGVRGRPWFVLAMRPGTEDDRPVHPYVTWEYLGDGRITEGSYFKDVLEAAVDLQQRAGSEVELDYRDDRG